PPFMHFELRRVMWAGRTARGNPHTEITARALLQEQAHVVARHDDLAVLDGLTAELIQRTLLHERRVLGVIDHRRTALPLERQVRVSLVSLSNITHKGAQTLDNLLSYGLIEGAQRATHHGRGRDDVVLRAGDDLPHGEHRRFLGCHFARY